MQLSFAESAVLLTIGFVLTTVLGGLLGSWLQRRLWRHQWKAEREKERFEATRALFEEVSRLMDRRLYRLTQLQLWVARKDPARAAAALDAYRTVLTEWNDSINRHLSLLEFYFGTALRERFDYGVGKEFVDLGSLAERLYRAEGDEDGELQRRLTDGIASLREQVYGYNLDLLRCMDQMQKAVEPTLRS